MTTDILKSANAGQVVIMGLILGFLAALFPGPVAAGLIVTLVFFHMHRISQRWEDPRPFTILTIGFVLRLSVIALLAVLSILKGDHVAFFGDSRYNLEVSLRALSVYAGILDIPSAGSLTPSEYGYNFFNWIYGAVYYLFGYSPFLIRLLNTLSGCMTAWMIYLITYRACGHRKPAAWAMGLTMFWPSQILWSVTLLKEPMLALYASVVIYLFVDMIRRKRWWYLIPLCVLWYPMNALRQKSHLLMLLTTGFSMTLFLPRRKKTGVLLVLLLAVVGLGAGRSRIRPMYLKLHDMVVGSQMGFITTGGSYYKFIPERFKPVGGSRETMTYREMTLSGLKAVYYYLCVPNLFVQIKKSQVPVLPQMIAWYILLVTFFPIGVLHLLRHHYRESGIILIYILVFTAGMALFTGNEGTAFRQRDMLIPFYFIPISVGFVNILGWLSLKLKPTEKRPQDLADGSVKA